MPYDGSTTGDHVSLLVRQPGLPDDDQRCKEILQDLERAVEEVLAEHGLDGDRLRTFGGHTYTSIDTDCPVCGDHLKLIEPSLGPENGAFATASCECGWRGDAIYRLIDLQETQAPASDDDDTSESETTGEMFDESSSVRLHDLRPKYIPY